jgi:uncharacterized protein (DUF305 family)
VRISRPLALIAGLFLLAGCGSLLAGCGTASPTPAPSAAVFDAADVLFVQQLIPHHRQGVRIAEIGADKTTDAGVRVLASAIAATEQDEVTRMTGWLAAWQQPATAPSGGPSTPAGKITALEQAKNVDHAFLTLLITHQQAAITLAGTELRNGRNLNALAFAKQILESRAAEIKQMQGFLAAER